MAGGGQSKTHRNSAIYSEFNASFLFFQFSHCTHFVIVVSLSLLLIYRYQIIAFVTLALCCCFFVVVSVLRHRYKSRYIFVDCVLLFLLLINFCTFSQLKCNSIKVFSVFLLGSFFVFTHTHLGKHTRTHTEKHNTDHIEAGSCCCFCCCCPNCYL